MVLRVTRPRCVPGRHVERPRLVLVGEGNWVELADLVNARTPDDVDIAGVRLEAHNTGIRVHCAKLPCVLTKVASNLNERLDIQVSNKCVDIHFLLISSYT